MFSLHTHIMRPLLVITLSLASVGCGITGGPRGRFGMIPNVGFNDPATLGTHAYGFTFGGEQGGMYYTLRGGTVDLDHLRGAADLTKAGYDITYKAVLKKKTEFTIAPSLELTTNKIVLEYPANWDTLPDAEKDSIARKVARIIAPAVAYQSTVWHEMLTWEGTSFAVVERQHESAFSWEDIYSDVLGSQLAARVLERVHTDEKAYNHGMTEIINEELQRLKVVPKARGVEITASVNGTWFKDGRLIKRNMDIGVDDGQINPSIIPGFTNESPIACPLPTLDGLKLHGFKATYSVSSLYLQNGTLQKMTGSQGDVHPYRDYPVIIKQMEKRAIEHFGYEVR